MSAVTDARARLQGRKVKPEPPAWRRPELAADFMQYRWVLAFDATLTNCGWVVFQVDYDQVRIMDKGTIRPRTSQVGYLETWHKMSQLRPQVEYLITRWVKLPARIVVEAPAVGGGSRTESSLIAGGLVWATPNECSVVSATRVSAVLLGDPRIKSEQRKPAIKEIVSYYHPAAAGRDFNEHERDALATGLVDLWGLKQEEAA